MLHQGRLQCQENCTVHRAFHVGVHTDQANVHSPEEDDLGTEPYRDLEAHRMVSKDRGRLDSTRRWMDL